MNDVQLRTEVNRWLESDDGNIRSEILFDIETMLVALDRFVRPGDLPLLGHGTLSNGYRSELAISVRILRKVLMQIRKLRNQRNLQIDLFERFVEQALLNDHRREKKRIERFDQADVDQSFAVLEQAIENLVIVGSGLERGSEVTGPEFFAYGELLRLTLSANRFFNPFRIRGFSQIFDRVESPVLRKVVQSISDPPLQSAVGLIVLSSLRLLHYLNGIELHARSIIELQDNLPMLALIRSDMHAMKPVFERRIPEMLAGTKDHRTATVLELCDALVFQFRLEGGKVFDHILSEAAIATKASILLASIENAHGILRNFVQQTVVWIVQIFEAEVEGSAIFPDFISRKSQSLALRDNVWFFNHLLGTFLGELEDETDSPEIALEVRGFCAFFMREGRKDVRASDLESFENLCHDIASLTTWDLGVGELRQRAKFELHKHRVFLDTTLQCIEQRSELADMPIDTEAVLARRRNEKLAMG